MIEIAAQMALTAAGCHGSVLRQLKLTPWLPNI
jgi:hypothetical protein